MRAHKWGTQLNRACLVACLGISIPTIKRYFDLIDDILLIRKLPMGSGNVRKRLVKAPKVYIRDSDITHALFNLTTLGGLQGTQSPAPVGKDLFWGTSSPASRGNAVVLPDVGGRRNRSVY
ncbi:DUF4143 domain-containing protein [Fibrella musci]|uniref:DUF4143 domain-containing protein n=1 Tax=Fibrella musci TaxID=3242485 RepID=UPI0035205878